MSLATRAILIASVSAFVLPAITDAADMPKRKSGLWEITLQADGRYIMTMQTCVDEKQDDLSAQQNKVSKRCAKFDSQRVGDRFEINWVCKFSKATATTRSLAMNPSRSGPSTQKSGSTPELGQSFHNQAAPRTPLESPHFGGSNRVTTASEKT